MSEVNSIFTAELGRKYAEINGKVTAEIEKIKAHDEAISTQVEKVNLLDIF